MNAFYWWINDPLWGLDWANGYSILSWWIFQETWLVLSTTNLLTMLAVIDEEIDDDRDIVILYNVPRGIYDFVGTRRHLQIALFTGILIINPLLSFVTGELFVNLNRLGWYRFHNDMFCTYNTLSIYLKTKQFLSSENVTSLFRFPNFILQINWSFIIFHLFPNKTRNWCMEFRNCLVFRLPPSSPFEISISESSDNEGLHEFC